VTCDASVAVNTVDKLVFTARRYASAVYAVVVCVSASACRLVKILTYPVMCRFPPFVALKGKGKVLSYSLLSVEPGADPGVQAVSPQVTKSARPAKERHRPSPSTKLYYLVTEAHGCKQLAHSCYSTARRPGLELATTESPVRCLTH